MTLELTKYVAGRVRAQGFAYLSAFEPAETTEAIARRLGEIVSPGRHAAVQTLRPRTITEATPNTYSGQYGMNDFPLHTDLAHLPSPPRYFLLRCVVGAEAVPTFLVDSALLISRVSAVSLARGLMVSRRPIEGKIRLLALRQRADNGEWLLRWDRTFIRPASEAGASAAAKLTAALAKAPRQLVTLQTPGDTLIVDNWRMLHGRGAIPHAARARLIERVYLSGLH